MVDYQVTLKCDSGKYKPVSAIVRVTTPIDLTNKDQRKEIITKGTIKIAQKRRWTNSDLKKYGYTKAIMREYPSKKSVDNEEKA